MAAAVRVAAPAHDGQATLTSAFSWPIPVGAQVGDLALVAAGLNTGSGTLPTPTDWTKISGPNVTGGNQTSYLFGKFLTSADLSGAFAATWTTSGKLHGGGIIISGAASIPSGASVQFLTDLTDGSTLVCPDITTPSANNLIVCIGMARLGATIGAGTASVDAAYTEDAEGNTAHSAAPNFIAEIAHRAALAGAAGSAVTGATMTFSDATTRGHMWTIAIEPSASVSPPDSSFTASASSGAAPLTVTFSDTSTGGPTSWVWDFGDGGSSTSQNPTHTFAAPGIYTVTLTAANSGGADATPATAAITVTGSGGYRLYKLRDGVYVPATIRRLSDGVWQ